MVHYRPQTLLRRKIEVPPNWCSMPRGVKDTTQGIKVRVTCVWTLILGYDSERSQKLRHCNPHT